MPRFRHGALLCFFLSYLSISGGQIILPALTEPDHNSTSTNSTGSCTQDSCSSEVCVWRGSANLFPVCGGKCYPIRSYHHRYIDGLMSLKVTEAQRCGVLSWMVSQWKLQMQSTSTSNSQRPDIERKLQSELSSKGLGCASDEDIDYVTPFLQQIATQYADQEDVSNRPEAWGTDWMLAFVKQPTSLKTFFGDFCKTDTITEGSLKAVYLALLHEDADVPLSVGGSHVPVEWHADEVPGSSSWAPEVTVCRPQDDRDARIFTAGKKISAACADMNDLNPGYCLEGGVVDTLSNDCFIALADFLEVDEQQRNTLFTSLTEISDACSAATSQERCMSVSATLEVEDIAHVLEEVKQGAGSSMNTAGTTVEPNQAAHIVKSWSILTLAVAALFATLL